MLATLTNAPFDGDDWYYEVKWDGYRALALINKGQINICSRNNKSFNETYYPIYEALKKWKIDVVLDGEIIVANKNGAADFGALQNWRSEADGSLIYYVFDVLWYEGINLMNLPLADRKQILQECIPVTDNILISDHIERDGIAFFKSAEELGLEGIIAKTKASLYKPGIRTRDWLKIKIVARQEVVIGGYTKNENTTKPFSALLVGVYENGKLHFTGKIGTGFNTKTQKELMAKFKKLEIKKSPFTTTPDVNKPSRFRPNPPHAEVIWLRPILVCEVNYRELTSDGVMRHPSFKGLRSDKDAESVTLETATPNQSARNEKKKKSKPLITPPADKEAKTFLNPKEKTQVRKIGGHEIKFSNLDKIFWPGEKFTKRDLLNYYYRISSFILPYLKNRPQSLNRFPNGINGMSFYQKDVTGKVPDWIEKEPYFSEGRDKNFMLCNNQAALLYMANMGCIEMNPWSSTIQRPDNPDFCIIDLDPDKNTFEEVIRVACVTYEILKDAEIECFCKTSGSTGIHIYIPLGRKYTYEASKEFGRVIAHLVNAELPKITSVERQIANRDRKLYVDFLQNRPQATVASAYSVRPKPGAPVSMPLLWDEVKSGMKMRDFNITNAWQRAMEVGDIFKGVLGKGIDMKKALHNLGAKE